MAVFHVKLCPGHEDSEAHLSGYRLNGKAEEEEVQNAQLDARQEEERQQEGSHDLEL
jgi:hypothetical protein